MGVKGISPADYSTDSLNMVERDECWLLEETGDGASQLLCRTNMTNYTLAWSSSASGTDQDLDYNEPGNYLLFTSRFRALSDLFIVSRYE